MTTGIMDSTVAPTADAGIFGRRGFLVIPRLVEPTLAAFLWSYVHTKFASLLLTVGDLQVPKTPAGYGDPAFDGLLEYCGLASRNIPDCGCYPPIPTFAFTSGATCSSAIATERLVK